MSYQNTFSIPIFVINLSKSVNRKNHIINMFKPLDINYQFFEAVDGTQLTQQKIAEIYDQKMAKKLRGRDLTLGELGCSLSHLGIYKKMLSENMEKVIILEDDACIGKNFVKIIKQINYFPNDWELVLLGYVIPKHNCKIAQFKMNNVPNYYLYKSISHFSAAHGYIINQNGAKKILKVNRKIYSPIDHFTGNYKTVNFYVVHPEVIHANLPRFPSDIGKDRFKEKNIIRKKLQKRSRILKQLSAINRVRKDIKWLRRIECFICQLIFKIKYKRD